MTRPNPNTTQPKSGLGIGAIAGAALVAGFGIWLAFGDKLSEHSAVSPALAGAAAAQFSPEQRSAIEGIVKEYLIENPEILFEVQSALESKLAKEEAERTKSLVSSHAKDIYRSPGAPVAGNPDGDITVVEFFDYNCGYCKRGLSDIAKLIESDDRVRVVFKEYPILREESEQAARVALAAGIQGKYWEVHRDMMATRGLVNEAVGLKIAEKHGLDLEKLKADMKGPVVQGELDRVKDLTKTLSINGTPHFLIGDRAIGGAPENLHEMLAKHVAELRKEGCSYC
ncbi:DSBA oxidoreductase [Hyphomicrobium nitrativorans NL23]|uniref:DSBA oxidoreductase n=1 Tax=Hyphomicrobium nitrativorans NL23 TaxID=1029756 RepID=V5SD90_9HYPH|nr:DsbA family protein [Hyphomicrobium nitrativorans]AHB47919.1 DSBA oxidoreductase [Hyphomicrobium nitrativorans NL23]